MIFFRYYLVPKDQYKSYSEQKNLDKEKKLDILLDKINKTYGNALRILSDNNTKENRMCIECSCGTEDKLLTLLINQRIKDKVENNKMFSAWDITTMLKAEIGPNYNINHTSVRNVVKRWFENRATKDFPEYSRTSIRLKNGKITNIYHPLIVLVESYPGFDSLYENKVFNTKTKCFEKNPLNEIEKWKVAYGKLYLLADDMKDTLFGFLDGQYNLQELKDVFDDIKAEFKKIDESKKMMCWEYQDSISELSKHE